MALMDEAKAAIEEHGAVAVVMAGISTRRMLRVEIAALKMAKWRAEREYASAMLEAAEREHREAIAMNRDGNLLTLYGPK